MGEIGKAMTGIVMAVIGIAILSVIVSSKANTSGVIQSAASGLGNIIAVAVSPVSGSGVTPNLSYSSGSSGGVGTLGSVSSILSGVGQLGNMLNSNSGLTDTSAGWDNNTQG